MEDIIKSIESELEFMQSEIKNSENSEEKKV